MARLPTFEFTLKVQCEGELPQSIINLLTDSKLKRTDFQQHQQRPSIQPAAATDDYNIMIDSESSDGDVEMVNASSDTSESEGEDESIKGARQYWAAQEEKQTRRGENKIKIKEEPDTDSLSGPHIDTSRARLGSKQNHSANTANIIPNSSNTQHSHLADSGYASASTPAQDNGPRINVTNNQNNMLNTIGDALNMPPNVLMGDRSFDASMYKAFKACRQTPGGPWIEIASPNKRVPIQGITGSLVVAVDGSCAKAKKGKLRAASAVFYHPDNPKNHSTFLPGEVQSETRAKFYAALVALACVKEMHASKTGPTQGFRRVVIKTDNIPLFRGVTQDVYGLRDIGSRKAKLKNSNSDMLIAIDEEINMLNDRDVRVQFWYVPSQQNEWAKRLAKEKAVNNSAEKTMQNWPKSLKKDWLV